MTKIVLQGALIAVATLIAFYMGLSQGDAALASTMAFATLALARLFHGFNCRGSRSIFKLGLFTNPYSVMAFGAGVLLLFLVLVLPFLKGLFQVALLSAAQMGWIVVLALLPTVVIQIVKVVKDLKDK